MVGAFVCIPVRGCGCVCVGGRGLMVGVTTPSHLRDRGFHAGHTGSLRMEGRIGTRKPQEGTIIGLQRHLNERHVQGW